MNTELRTFKFDSEFQNIDHLYQYLIKNTQFIEKKIGIRIGEEGLERRPFCIIGKENITQRKILIYASEDILPENLGELIILAESTDADIIILIVEKINSTILGPMNWLAKISNEDIEFILAEGKFKKDVSKRYKTI